MLLPNLPFGQSVSPPVIGATAVTEVMRQVIPTLTVLHAPNASEFRAKVATRQIGATRVMGDAKTQCRLAIEDAQGWHLMVPCLGASTINGKGGKLEVTAGSAAALLPNLARTADPTTGSVVAARIDPDRLGITWAAITGNDPAAFVLPEHAHQIDLTRQKGGFGAFLNICGLIDSTWDNDALADTLGIEDMIYRWIAQIMVVGNKSATEICALADQSFNLDTLCDMIRATRERPLTLTEMEQATGVSSRTLQYEFKRRFQCSPMQWQQHERMTQARQRLLGGAPQETITDLAIAMGFSSSAAFATLYKRKFGETPSDTLRRHRA